MFDVPPTPVLLDEPVLVPVLVPVPVPVPVVVPVVFPVPVPPVVPVLVSGAPPTTVAPREVLEKRERVYPGDDDIEGKSDARAYATSERAARKLASATAMV